MNLLTQLNVLLLLNLAASAIAGPSQALSLRTDPGFVRAVDGTNITESSPTNQTEATCRQVNTLMFLVEVADDPEKKQKLLNAVNNQTATEAAIAAAPEKLKEFSGNSTLMETCSIIRAGKKLERSCRRLRIYEKLSEASSNETLRQELLANANNATKLKEKIANANEKLMAMTANSSLVDACDSLGGVNKGLVSSGARNTNVERLTLGLLLAMVAGLVCLF